MTPEEADQRIIKSRQTLAVYQRMVAAGMKPESDLGMMDAEICILLNIAQEHHEKTAKIEALIGQWRELMGKIRTVH
jgi:hypothetical protein